MVPALCTLLFAVLFLTVWAGSVLTGSFDRENFYSLLRYKSQFHILFFQIVTYKFVFRQR